MATMVKMKEAVDGPWTMKERMKKVGAGGLAARRGPDEDEIFEDEDNEWKISTYFIFWMTM